MKGLPSPATYVVLLRGINVGGAHRVAMADLRAVCSEAGCDNVRTYIQSGNIVVSSTETAEALARHLHLRIAAHAGFDVPVVVRTAAEMTSVLRRCPFDTSADPTKLVVWFASAAFEEATLGKIEPQGFGQERFALDGRELFLWLPSGQAGSALLPVLGRTAIGRIATARNWRTVVKLEEMATTP